MANLTGVVNDKPLKPWLDETGAKLWTQIKLGYNGLMLERQQRQLRAAEKIADIAMKGNTDGIDSLYPTGEDEEMAVNIGNEYHYHLEGVPAGTLPASVPVTNTNTTTTTEVEKIVQVPVTTTQPTKNSWMPLILGGALALSGLGGWGFAWYNHSHNPVVDTDTDTDHETDVTFPQ